MTTDDWRILLSIRSGGRKHLNFWLQNVAMSQIIIRMDASLTTSVGERADSVEHDCESIAKLNIQKFNT